MKRLRFVEVEWYDASSSAVWCGPEDLPSITSCITRGWLVDESDQAVVIAGTLQLKGPDVGEVITIPRGMVKRIRRCKISYGR